MSQVCKVELEGKTYELPLMFGTEGEKAIDISKLRDLSGYITLDSGYKNTGATTSKITFLDGELGILRHRGYSIEDLAEKSNFLEVAYLVINGELPKKDEFESFTKRIKENMLIHEDLRAIIMGFPSSAHPMGVLSATVGALTAFHPNSLDPNISKDALYQTIIQLIAQMPTIAAWSYRKQVGRPINYPKRNMSYAGNFLQMMFDNPWEGYSPDPVVESALDKLFILHADHEQNCSTSTVRLVGSAQASLFASISSGISALWGPLHGGANQAVIEMLEMIMQDGGNVEKYINKAKDKNDTFRLMGFGHRVYKNFDPRAKIIKKAADDVLKKLGVNDPALEIAKKIEEIALKDEYFVSRSLYPNVDFYSGIIYRAIGIPTEMFTVMFALGRLPGWIAQWKEMREQKEPIGRPRQLYVGNPLRPYVDMQNR